MSRNSSTYIILEFQPALRAKFYSRDGWPFYRHLYNYFFSIFLFLFYSGADLQEVPCLLGFLVSWLLGGLAPWLLSFLFAWPLVACQPSYLAPWLLGSLVAWILGCLAPWLPGFLVAWMLGSFVAWLLDTLMTPDAVMLK